MAFDSLNKETLDFQTYCFAICNHVMAIVFGLILNPHSLTPLLLILLVSPSPPSPPPWVQIGGPAKAAGKSEEVIYPISQDWEGRCCCC